MVLLKIHGGHLFFPERRKIFPYSKTNLLHYNMPSSFCKIVLIAAGLVSLGYYKPQNTIHLCFILQMFISYSSGEQKSQIRAPRRSSSGVSRLHGLPWLPSHCTFTQQTEIIAPVCPLVRASLPVERAPPSRPNYLPKAPPPNTAQIRASTDTVWETQTVQGNMVTTYCSTFCVPTGTKRSTLLC